MSAASIRSALLSASDLDKAFVFKQQADQFEEELLGAPFVDGDYLALFLDIVSDPVFASQPGAWNFVARMYTDREKLHDSQLLQVLNAFTKGYPHYRDERMRLLACDFIARTFEPRLAISAFEKIATTARDKKARGPLRVGLDILEKRTSEGSADRSATQALLKSLR